MDLRGYMTKLRERDFNNCADLNYNHSDKDSGYRSGLRFLGIARTAQTDDIADEMIYGTQHKKPFVSIENMQMELFA